MNATIFYENQTFHVQLNGKTIFAHTDAETACNAREVAAAVYEGRIDWAELCLRRMDPAHRAPIAEALGI